MTFTLRSAGIAFALAGMLASGAVLADKGGKGNGKGDDKNAEKQRYDKGDKGDRHESSRSHFDDRHRSYVRDYYADHYKRGSCPPGLAKKHNGCMPPGLAKKWHIGHALPKDVVYYEVPRALVLQIGAPPAGYRYVRVSSDILMMAVGTRMIVDAIQDLGRI